MLTEQVVNFFSVAAAHHLKNHTGLKDLPHLEDFFIPDIQFHLAVLKYDEKVSFTW